MPYLLWMTMVCLLHFILYVSVLPLDNKLKAKEIIVEPETEIRFPCNDGGSQLYWKWLPKYPKCFKAIINSDLCIITNKSDIQIMLEEFEGRLQAKKDQANGKTVLVLQRVRMSDSGLFTCTGENRNMTSFSLLVKDGFCYNSINFKAESQTGGTLKFSCSKCKDFQTTTTGSFAWQLNGTEVKHSSTIVRTTKNTLILKQEGPSVYGKWSCVLQENVSYYSEYCLEGPNENVKRKANTEQSHPSTTESPSTTTPNHSKESSGKDKTASSLVVAMGLLVGLFIVAVIAGIWYHRSRPQTRKSRKKKNREDETGNSPGVSDMIVRAGKEFLHSECIVLEESQSVTKSQDCEDIHYASLIHFPRSDGQISQPPSPTSDSIIYASVAKPVQN